MDDTSQSITTGKYVFNVGPSSGLPTYLDPLYESATQERQQAMTAMLDSVKENILDALHPRYGPPSPPHLGQRAILAQQQRERERREEEAREARTCPHCDCDPWDHDGW